MAVRRWAWVIGLALAVALPLCGQQQNQQQQSQSGQQAQPEQQDKRSTQDLPSAPQPQPTAGQKKEEKLPSAPPAAPLSPPPSDPGPYGPAGPSTTSAPPRTAPSDTPGTSSSKEDKVDISPPANDATTHPNAGLDNSDVGEFHPFDPHHAAKDVEVGDFYYKQRNYRAAISRYREALLYKPNDAIATYRLADALEKSGDLPEAAQNYQAYLKILPYGPRAGEAHKALQRLKSKGAAVGKPAATAAASKPKQ